MRPGAQVDDDVFVALKHAGGTISHLWASAVAADLGPRLRVLGSAASYVTHGLDPQEEALRRGGSPTDPGWGQASRVAWTRFGTPDDHRPIPTLPGAYQDYYAAVRDAVHGLAPAPVTIDEAIEVIAVIEDAQRSVREGSTVHR